MKNFKTIYPFQACESEENNGLITVLFKNPKPSFVEKIFFKKLIQKPYKIDLDKVGTYIWKLCDGKHNVEAIIQKARQEFGSEIEPVEERVEKFVKQLSGTKLINLFEKKD
jgi:hypothetical protein